MSQATSQTKTIDGVEYEVYMLDVDTAERILIQLAKTSLPTIGAFIDSVGSFEALLDSHVEQSGGFGAAMEKLVQGLDHEALKGIRRDLAQVTVVKGKGKLHDLMATHFHGRMAHMYKWLGFALKVQYQDFSDVFGTLRAAVQSTQNQAAQE